MSDTNSSLSSIYDKIHEPPASTLNQLDESEVSERSGSDPDLVSSRESLLPAIEAMINSNNAPSAGGQIDAMRRCLSDSVREIVNLNGEIERTKEYLARLEAKRQEIQDYIEKQKAVLNPIRRLPSEVLTSIFIQSRVATGYWLNDELIFSDSLDMRSMQWVLSHVCTQWRSVAFTISSLWSQLHVKLPSGSDGHPMLLGRHVDRSCGSLLSVYVKGSFLSKPERHPIFTTLMQQANRWEKLRFHMRVEDVQSSLSRTRPLFPSLYSLVIVHSESWRPDPSITSPSWVCDVFQSAPKLSCVVLRDICLPHRVLLPWSAITSLKLYVPGASFAVNDLLTMLDGAKMLESIILQYHFVHGLNDATDLKTIRLASLNYMGLCWSTKNSADADITRGGDQLLEHLIVPRLQTFHDYTYFSDRSVTLPSLVELWSRSGKPPILILEFTVSRMDDELLEFLGQLGDTLTTLRLKKSEGDFDETLINALTCRVDCEKHFLPRLNELLLRGGMNFDATLLVNMIGSRIGMVGNGVSGFRQVTLNCKNQEPPRNVDAFNAFKEDERFKEMKWTLVL